MSIRMTSSKLIALWESPGWCQNILCQTDGQTLPVK